MTAVYPVGMTLFDRSSFRALLALALFLFAGQVAGQNLGSINKNADGVQSKRWSGTTWSGVADRSSLQGKSFPITEWDKRYSSLGSQRAGSTFQKRKEKDLIDKKFKNYDTIEHELSGWDQRISDVYKRAGIQTDERSKKISNQALYSMMLQDTRSYAELGEELSLRELNRYQFRRNRDDGEVPVEKVGAGESK
ncbi:MAG: hypothetical protein AAGC73_03600 [Verrucomicrobiota bacterium]